MSHRRDEPYRGRPGGSNDRGEKNSEFVEEPTHTLFVRHLGLDTKEESVLELFKRYGEVKKSFSQLKKKG